MLLSHPPTLITRREPSTAARLVCHRIAGVVAGQFQLDPAEVRSATRGAPRAAYARQVAMYLAHVSFALSFETIGRVFNRDRTTVAHACRVVEDSRDDARLDRRLAALEQICGAASGQRLDGASDGSI
ncbi:MAG: DNA replication initiation protein [Rhizobiales bacterium]|nr:DNA replication initiation protein [Hyphomicrobiales bacterium]